MAVGHRRMDRGRRAGSTAGVGTRPREQSPCRAGRGVAHASPRRPGARTGGRVHHTVVPAGCHGRLRAPAGSLRRSRGGVDRGDAQDLRNLHSISPRCVRAIWFCCSWCWS
jgi:hypothetical protein